MSEPNIGADYAFERFISNSTVRNVIVIVEQLSSSWLGSADTNHSRCPFPHLRLGFGLRASCSPVEKLWSHKQASMKIIPEICQTGTAIPQPPAGIARCLGRLGRTAESGAAV